MPCKYLNEEVLGIKPTTPGFATVDILPHLGRKLTRVAGTTATLKGDISASFDVASGKCRVTVPFGVTASVGIPKVERTIKSIAINGVLAWEGRYHPVASIGGANGMPILFASPPYSRGPTSSWCPMKERHRRPWTPSKCFPSSL